LCDGFEDEFITSHIFKCGTTMVYLNGERLELGINYVEDLTYTKIILTVPPAGGDVLIVDFVTTK